MGRDNKRHPNGTVLIEPRSSAKQLLKKPTEEAPVLLLAAVIPVLLLTAVIPVLLAQAAPPVVLLATWDITVLLLLAELFATFHRSSLWLFGPAELFHAYAQVARDALGTEVPSSTLFISQPIAGFLIAVP